ncbi:DeoR/GlpR transcriptional regulator [bacterium]|nr:DeoR/GlpR transcriptional regulator [bacterium]
MLKTRRQKEITEILKQKGVVEIKDLCRLFNVVEMTLRRDLDELIEAGKGSIVRAHGGAMLSDTNMLLEAPFDIRDMQNKKEKEWIARVASSMIREGQKIILDSGTTTYSLAKQLDNSKKLMVVTNAINIATELNARTNISVMPVGGALRKNTYSCTGYFAETMIKQIRVDIAFIGVGGISETGDLSNGSELETGVKQVMLKAGKKKVVLADFLKIGHEEFSIFANLKCVDLLITDSKAPKQIINKFIKSGIKVKVAN